MHCTWITLTKVESISFEVVNDQRNSVEPAEYTIDQWWDVPAKYCVKSKIESEFVLVRIKTKKGVARVCI